MCYEFLHDCKSDFLDRLIRQANATDFFIICIGQLNYLYFQDSDCVKKLLSLLSDNGIKLHPLPPEEMLGVLDFPDTKQYQVFHGSEMLYNHFRRQLIAGTK